MTIGNENKKYDSIDNHTYFGCCLCIIFI